MEMIILSLAMLAIGLLFVFGFHFTGLLLGVALTILWDSDWGTLCRPH